MLKSFIKAMKSPKDTAHEADLSEYEGYRFVTLEGNAAPLFNKHVLRHPLVQDHFNLG